MPTEEVDPGCVKCVIVGDEGVGKTCMALSYANREYPEETESTIFDTYAGNYHFFYSGSSQL